MSDITGDLKRDYFLGNFQSCINKAINAPKQNEQTKVYMCLSYVHLKRYDLLDNELKNTDYLDQTLKLVALFADYIRYPDKRELIVGQVNDIVNQKTILVWDIQAPLVLSAIYVRHKLYGKALEILEKPEKWDKWDSLPTQYAKVEIYLLMNRTDLAEDQLHEMQTRDDFATVTQLAFVLVKLATNKPGDALDALAEMEDKYGGTPKLKNLQTSAFVCLGDYIAAKEHCEESLRLDHDNPEALINMVHILTKLRDDKGTSHFDRLCSTYRDHEFVLEFERMKSELGVDGMKD